MTLLVQADLISPIRPFLRNRVSGGQGGAGGDTLNGPGGQGGARWQWGRWSHPNLSVCELYQLHHCFELCLWRNWRRGGNGTPPGPSGMPGSGKRRRGCWLHHCPSALTLSATLFSRTILPVQLNRTTTYILETTGITSLVHSTSSFLAAFSPQPRWGPSLCRSIHSSGRWLKTAAVCPRTPPA